MTPTEPNFFIVGAAKSGTTSLYHCLRQHPEVFMSEIKEPSFFMDWEGGIRTRAQYASLFAGAHGKAAVGEASTGYLYAEEAVSRIRMAVPSARFVMILRNPADMCFALWRHMRRIGRRGEPLGFEDALEREPTRMADPAFRAGCVKSWHANFYYFHRALYYEQVKRYLDAFGGDRVQIHIFDDFKKDPLATCRAVFTFLGVTEDFTPDIVMQNVGAEVWHRGLQKAVTSPSPFFERIGAIFPPGFTGKVRARVEGVNRKPPQSMEPQTRQKLLELYAPDVDSLGRLIGKNLNFWLKSE